MLGKQKIKCQIIYLTGWKWFTGCCYNAIYVNLSQVPDTWAIKICFSGVTDGRLKGIFWVFTDLGVVKANTGQNMHLIKINFIIRNKDIFSFLSIHSRSGANISSHSKSCILQLLNSGFCLKYKKKDFLKSIFKCQFSMEGKKIRNSKT